MPGMTPIVMQAGIELTDTVSPVVTATAKAIITKAIFANTTNSDIAITVHRVASGGSPSAANLIMTRAVAASASDYAPELAGMVLNTGDSVQANAPAPGVNAFASGVSASG